MTPRKLKIGIARFPYGGNGATSAEHPSIGDWVTQTVLKIKQDERCDSTIARITISDTPITMSRNRSVLEARDQKVDALLMIDSDNFPDYELALGDARAKPFWDTSFDFLYKHYEKGPVVVGAPYSGPSPINNVYVFRWANHNNKGLSQDMRLEPYSREEAFMRAGLEQVAALPTGVILFDMRIFDLTEPLETEVGDLARGWFYYDWRDKYAAEKISTEDVTATRDMNLICKAKLGYGPIYCNWDAWAGHCKPEIIGKPRLVSLEQVNARYQYALGEQLLSGKQLKVIGDDSADKQEPPDRTEVDDLMQVLSSLSYSRAMANGERQFMAELAKMASPDDESVEIAEIGTHVGDGALALCNSGLPKSHIYCIDNHSGVISKTASGEHVIDDPSADPLQGCRVSTLDGETLRKCWELNTHVVQDHLTLIEQDSAEAAKDFADGSLDMVFIDADHSYEACKKDIAAWRSKVRPGGILSGHDYNRRFFPGVIRAVEEALEDVKIRGSIWYTVIPAHNGHLPSLDDWKQAVVAQ